MEESSSRLRPIRSRRMASTRNTSRSGWIFSSSDSVAVFGVWRGMSPGDSIENMLLWDFYVADMKAVEPFAHDGILTLPMLKESPAQKCSYAELGKVLYTKMAA